MPRLARWLVTKVKVQNPPLAAGRLDKPTSTALAAVAICMQRVSVIVDIAASVRLDSDNDVRTAFDPSTRIFRAHQLQAGRFRSRDDVITAALALLEEQAASHEMSRPRSNRTIPTDRGREPSVPAVNEMPERRVEQLPGDKAALPTARRSPRGLLADLPSHLGPDDFKDARSEVWSRFLDGRAE